MSGKVFPDEKDEKKKKKKKSSGLLMSLYNYVARFVEWVLGLDDESNKRSLGNRIYYAWRALSIGEFGEFKNIVSGNYKIDDDDDDNSDDSDDNEDTKKKKKKKKEGEEDENNNNKKI